MRAELSFATPRKLPKASTLRGRVVVLDVAFASDASGGGFAKITQPFIAGLGSRLAAWVDHHDHALHATYAADPRFVLATKAQHGACPEMVTPELVQRTGAIETIVCHTDFDGLCSAAKWLREGREPYVGADDDARAVDTRIGTPGPFAQRIDAALRGRPRDTGLMGIVVRHLASGLSDASLWAPIDAAAMEGRALSTVARELAGGYAIVELDPRKAPSGVTTMAFVDVTARKSNYDKTLLLLLGQERASIAVVLDDDTLSMAAPFDSGVNFLSVLGLSGGMPTLVSIPKKRLGDALAALGVRPADAARLS